MSAEDRINTLLGEIAKSRQVLARIEGYYDEYSISSVDPASPTRENAIVLSEILCNYYTCLETLFLRVSQFFENDLSSDRWHQDLLEKMTLNIEAVRPRLLSDASCASLRELMRFRHFKRYYLEFDYDWDKLEFLQRKLAAARRDVSSDVDAFVEALQAAGRAEA